MLRKVHSVDSKKAYREAIQAPLRQVGEIGEADIVVGIPFYHNVDTIRQVVVTVEEGLRRFYPQLSCVIICAGAWIGGKTLDIISEIPVQGNVKRIAFLLDKRTDGRGWALKAIMELTSILGADLAIFEADLMSKEGNDGTLGLSPDWVRLLLEPIKKEGMDLVTTKFERHPFDATTTSLIAYPLIASIYGFKIHEPLKGEFGISNKLIEVCLKEMRKPDFFHEEGYGADILFTTCAITNRFKLCEVSLGIKVRRHSPGQRETFFKEAAEALFERVVRDRRFWAKRRNLIQFPMVFGSKRDHQPQEMVLNQKELLENYKKGFNQFYHTVYERVLPKNVSEELEALIRTCPDEFEFSSSLWVEIIYDFILAFAFEPEISQEDLLNSLVALYEGRLVSFTKEVNSIIVRVSEGGPRLANAFWDLGARKLIEDQAEEFIRGRDKFLEKWDAAEVSSRPYLPELAYWEFIPGVPLLLPQEVNGVSAQAIYEKILERHRKKFEYLVHVELKVRKGASPLKIARAVEKFMERTEFWLDKALLGGDISTVEGLQKIMAAIFRNLTHHEAFTLRPDVTLWLLRQVPPAILITKMGKRDLNELLSIFSPNDILALASWSEEKEYMEKIHVWLRESLRPEHLTYSPIKSLVLHHNDFPSLSEMKEPSALSKLTGRVLVTNLPKGRGGNFPKLRYLTTVGKNIVEAERFGEIWRKFAEERKAVGDKVVNSIEGHWGREPFSVHNIFESGNQRELVTRFKEMSLNLEAKSEDNPDNFVLSQHLRTLADSYHLALTLPNGEFISCSAWTWASCSFKGCRGSPTPLCLHVERDWASTEFLMEYFIASGGSEEEVDEKVTELMAKGEESKDLSLVLFGEKEENIMPPQLLTPYQPKAGSLKRFKQNPILRPIEQHLWESKYVFNPGAMKLNGKVYIVYRAVGKDMVSRLGLAISSDGFQVDERLPYPIFEPKGEEESLGCEDPRLTLIGDRIYMFYTAYSIVPQINLATISVDDFLRCHFEAWERHGAVFPGFPNKDACLFPEKFNGKYVLYHRITPSMWLSFSNAIKAPWSREEHGILMGPRSGMAWDGVKIGGGAPPIKTEYGWLLIYHGVDFSRVYRLGVVLVDLKDPSRLLYRSPNPILEPEELYEVGEKGKSWVPNVVFTCGVVPMADKDMLEADDEIIVYYGAADTVIGVAKGKIADLIPQSLRSELKAGGIELSM